jgi:uncharacterized membrane protein
MQTSSGGTDPRTWAIIVWALYLASGVTGITVIIALIIAYVKRPELAGTPFESHMTYAIRTFWIGLLGVVVGTILTFVVIGIALLVAMAVWVLYRMIRGLILAIDGRPIPNPESWI